MIRRIEIPQDARMSPAPQATPRLEWVKISDLRVDDRYQRPLGKSNWVRIKKIAANFQWSRFSPLLVAPQEDGGYAIVDGQHRAHAAALCGFKAVPVMIVDIDSREQARSFSWVNDQVTRISTFHIYKAALAAGDDWAVRSKAAVEAAGCILMTCNSSTNNKKSGEIYTIALIRKMIEDKNESMATAGLTALRKYDTGNRVALYSGVLLKPWLMSVAERPQYAKLPLEAFLEAHDPYRVIDRVSRLRKESGAPGKAPVKLEREAFLMLMGNWAEKRAF